MNRETREFQAVADLPPLLTVRKMTALTDVSGKTVRRWIQRGSLNASRLSHHKRGRLRIEKQSLIHMLTLLRVKTNNRTNSR